MSEAINTITRAYLLCDCCRIAVANDDTSSCNHDDSESFEGSLSSIPMFAVERTDDNGEPLTTPGYADCYVCNEVTIGAYVWEAETQDD